MGGIYEYRYNYDDLYRLTGSTGSFGFTHHYNLNMKYSPSGNIVEKDVTANTYIGWVQKNVIYSNAYQYNDRPHTVSKAGTCTYNWDLNGNMVQKIDNNPLNHSRNLWWDEENRLASTADYGGNAPNYLSVYIYNAGGDRVWKVAGVEQTMLVNGQPTVQTVNFNKTLYCGAYMVMDDHQYTKHYFIEGERVCTKIGGGFPSNHIFRDSVAVISGNFNQICKMEWEMVNRVAAKVCKIAPQITIKPQLLSAQIHIPTRETNMFFYHSDHLGSSSFITDAGGDAIQHLQYLPFGETFVDERHSSPYYTPYKFSGKEKDDETGFSYFGARYYDSGLSVWLSVDPLCSKYPSLSPFSYCANNPVILIDPNGNSFISFITIENNSYKVVFNGTTTTMQQVVDNKLVGEAVNYSAGTNQFIDDMITAYKYIVNTPNADVDGAMQKMAEMAKEIEVKYVEGFGEYDNGVIKIDFNFGTKIRTKSTKGYQSPALAFWGEVYHGYIDNIDIKTRDEFKKADARPITGHPNEEEYVHVEKEGKVIDALKSCDKNNKETKRTTYHSGWGNPIRTKGVTSAEKY